MSAHTNLQAGGLVFEPAPENQFVFENGAPLRLDGYWNSALTGKRLFIAYSIPGSIIRAAGKPQNSERRSPEGAHARAR